MTHAEIRNCEDALRLLATHLDGELRDRSRDEMEHHLSTCRSCWSRAEFERLLKERLVSLGQEPARPELRTRIQGLIRSFQPAASE